MAAEIRIFPTSREEFATLDEFRMWLHVGLRLRGGDYYLRSGNRIATIAPGSVALFRFGDELVGEAIVAEDVKPCEHSEREVLYEAVVRFEPGSIRIFRPPVPVNVFGGISGRDLSVANSYFKFEDWSVYPKLLAEVIANGGFC